MCKYLFICMLCIAANIFATENMLSKDIPTSSVYRHQLKKSHVFCQGKAKDKKHHKSSSCENTNRQIDPIVSPWIERRGDVFVYKFNVFNLAPNEVSMRDLKSMMKAQEKDFWQNYRKQYGAAIDVKVYPAEEINNPKLFQGDRIPFFLVESSPIGALAFHTAEATGPANSESFIWAGSSIADTLGLQVPSNLPPFTPYGAADTSATRAFIERNKARNNPYVSQNFLDQISFSFNHEFKEILGDDSIQNWTVFDTFAPTVASWHYGIFDEHGVCLNGTVGPDGYVHLPLFNDVFPAGGLFTAIQENCDPLELADVIETYFVDGWAMTDNVNSNYWKGYYLSDKIKWDKCNLIEKPLQPFAGEQDDLFFLDFETGTTFFGVTVNQGPVTYLQRGASVHNNFPPDYTYVRFFFDFNTTRAGDGKINLNSIFQNFQKERS